MKWIGLKLNLKIKPAIFFEITSKLSEVVNIPVILIGNVRDVDTAQNILEKSNIQLTCKTREVDLVKKWNQGDFNNPKCISCNTCLDPSKHIGICVFNKNQCSVKYAEPAPLQSIKLDQYRVTYIPDGVGLTRNFEAMLANLGTNEEDSKKLKEYLNKEGKLVISYGAFLIENKKDKILFDLGMGQENVSYIEGQGNGGELLNNLKLLGIERENITKVIYSHFHPSHIGWTSIEENGKRVLTFPNAEYYSSKYEWEFWENKTEGPISIDPVKFKQPLRSFGTSIGSL